MHVVPSDVRTRVSKLLEGSLYPLLGEELGARNEPGFSRLTTRLDVAEGHDVALGYELHHDSENRVDLSLQASPGSLIRLGGVELPQWWPALIALQERPPQQGLSYGRNCWLEFDQLEGRLVLAGVFQYIEVARPEPPIQVVLVRLAQDLASLEPAWARLSEAALLQDLLAVPDRPHYVGLMTGRGQQVVRFISGVSSVAALRSLASTFRALTAGADLSHLVEPTVQRWEELTVKASFDYDLAGQCLLPRFGLELSLKPTHRDPARLEGMVNAFCDLSEQIRRESISAAAPHVKSWRVADDCYLMFSHIKVSALGQGDIGLKTYLGASTEEIVLADDLAPAEPVLPVQIAPSWSVPARGPYVYALGSLGYDFASETRRDYFRQGMPRWRGTPPNPYDERQMSAYLQSQISEAQALTWTLNIDSSPAYALEAEGPFAADTYAALCRLLASQVAIQEPIERVSIPAQLTGRSVRLLSGQPLLVLQVSNLRGLYGWRSDQLLRGGGAAPPGTPPQLLEGPDQGDEALRRGLHDFLSRLYHDLRNPGVTPAQRALNFAATNAVQAVGGFAQAVQQRMQLETIEVTRSLVCRLDSDCWDVKLKFFDPENGRRARTVYRYTVDVCDMMPVSLGEVRTWSSPR